jgi:3-oxoadipate enol-lactonase
MSEPAPVDVDASPIAYRVVGDPDSSLVLFLHGLGGGRTAWDPQLRAVGERRRALAWDMPGYGASAPVGGQLDFEAITDALAGLLDHLGVDAAHLVGLSFGGMHAQHMALVYPDRVASLTLVDTSPAFGLDGTTRNEWLASRLDSFDTDTDTAAFATEADGGAGDAATADVDGAAGERAPAVRSLADIGEHVVRAIAAPGFAGPGFDESVDAFGRISVDAFRSACHCLVEHDLRGRLGAIVVPTLVVVGELDTETPPSYAAAIAAEIPGARLVEVPDAGHLLPAEAPDVFNRLLLEFLDDVEGVGTDDR